MRITVIPETSMPVRVFAVSTLLPLQRLYDSEATHHRWINFQLHILSHVQLPSPLLKQRCRPRG